MAKGFELELRVYIGDHPPNEAEEKILFNRIKIIEKEINAFILRTCQVPIWYTTNKGLKCCAKFEHELDIVYNKVNSGSLGKQLTDYLNKEWLNYLRPADADSVTFVIKMKKTDYLRGKLFFTEEDEILNEVLL